MVAPGVASAGRARVPVLQVRSAMALCGPSQVDSRMVKDQCGTETGYGYHIKRRQPTCAPCREAHRLYVANARLRAKAGLGKRLLGCGTYAAAQRHLKRGEPVDWACRLARSQYMAEWRSRDPEKHRSQRAIRFAKTAANGGIAPIEKHGGPWSYSNWNCHCQPCIDGHTNYQREIGRRNKRAERRRARRKAA